MLLALSSNQKLGLALVAAAFVGFALLSALVIPRANPDFPERRLNLFVAVSVVFTVAMLSAVVLFAKESEEETHATTATETTTETTATTETGAAGSDAAGKVIFTANCGSCHTLDDAGTSGSVGPNLDQAAPTEERVVTQVTNGGGAMPPFKGVLSEQQIVDVAAYVSAVTGS